MTIQSVNRIITRGEVSPALTNNNLTVVYESLLVRCARDETVGYLALIGFDETVAEAVQSTLGVQAHLMPGVSAELLRPDGLYVVKTPEADRAQGILGSQTDVHHNGLARVICQ